VGDWSGEYEVSESYSADVTEFAAENPEFRLRYRLENSVKRLWWAVDDVSVTADVFTECATGFEGP